MLTEATPLVITIQGYYNLNTTQSIGPASLRGKRIGVILNSTSEYFAYRYLRDVAGLAPGEYTLVGGSATNRGLCYALPCANGTLPDLLKSGEIDAMAAYEKGKEGEKLTRHYGG
ncbi:hypothetical protein QBC44DRAFT_370380 [Cladorrhinum sp. PSN332]|nr:hypothetical protein QBC44DRAFT_370380 [Cladorrhinum sp. PSN332]